MALSKLEIQQMLREMNVKFGADEPLDALKQRLQKENHSLWLKSVAGSRTANGRSDNVVVRRRRKSDQPQETIVDPPDTSGKSESFKKIGTRRETDYSRRNGHPYQPQTIEKPAPGKPWKAAADGTEPFNRKKRVFDSVLKRARRCCEHCGRGAEETSGTTDLEPFHILPLSEGGEHSIKNVVALCPACMEILQGKPDPKVLKELKRKTRSRIYDSLQVVKKKKIHSRRRHPGRRKQGQGD
ncbi:hypothetical protein DSCA_01980 [Desulfosarcina alkanivorans]|uniref:HNH nuclease domain-containing protein n=1 Tax=Desulfosarcina alkanivorans TaxID=571177 RepID=A0A5K7YAT5_9BACT|nr:HNH endonuclease signature motif containing protein [Desulfosarcina alkanivorans]BBO66268.1 hypothetical protein DSCA_01980 [Desulfosarcina alkanivorans]